MELTITKQNLFKGLQVAQTIADTKGSMPILSSLMIEASGPGINISATDLEIGIKGFYEAEVISEGKFVPHARKIFDIVRELPDQPISLKSDARQWATLTCGQAYFRIPGFSPDDFPQIPEYDGQADWVQLDSGALKEMIAKTHFAIASDEIPSAMSGLFLELQEGTMRMVATDGHRLTHIRRDVEGERESGVSVVIPKKTVAEVSKILGDRDSVKISFQGNHIVFKKGNLTLTSRLLEEQFPDWEQVIPKEHDKRITANRAEFLAALRRVSLLANERSRLVTFFLSEGKMTLKAESAELGEAMDVLPATYPHEPLRIGFNARYILDVLGVLESDEVSMELSDPLSPVIIRPEGANDYMCVVMPMRVETVER